MTVDRIGRHARNWSYIQGSTRNHENEGKTNNVRCMLYSLYAVLSVYCTWCKLVLGVNLWSWHGEIVRDDLILCSAMRVELWTRKREMGNDDENDVEDMSEYEKSGLRLAWLVWGTPRICGITHLIGTRTCRIGDGKMSCTRNSLMSQFIIKISPISSHISPSRLQLYLRTPS